MRRFYHDLRYLVLLSVFLLAGPGFGCPEAIVPFDRDARDQTEIPIPDLPEDNGLEPDAGQDDLEDPSVDQEPVDLTPDPTSDPLPDAPADLPVDPIPDTPTDLPVDPTPDTPTDMPVDTTADGDVATDAIDIPSDASDLSDPTVDTSDSSGDPTDYVQPPEDLPSGGTMLISEVCDHTRPAARFVEIYNATGYAVNLSGWTLEFWDYNVSTPQTYYYPNRVLANGTTFVVARNEVEFELVFPGREADAYSTVIDGSGNDTYALNDTYGLVDIYGEIGVNGYFEAWEYIDSVAKRNTDVIRASTVWQASEWTITAGSEQANPGSRD